MMVKQLGADIGGHWNGLVLQSTHLEVIYLASMEPPTLSTTQELMVELYMMKLLILVKLVSLTVHICDS